MGIGSGLGSSFGLAPEVTYGTYVAPTRWLDGTASLRKTKATFQGGGMAAGRMMQPGARRVFITSGGQGTFNSSVMSTRMGNLLNGLMGGTVAPVQQGATTAYLQTHPLADTFGKFYTMQSGIPNMAGTVNPYTFLGCQIDSCEFSCEVNGPLTSSWQVTARQVVESETLAAPSYPTSNEFHFGQATLKLGTFASEALVDAVRKVTVKIERMKHDGGPYMGNAGLRSQGILNDWTKISGTIDADFGTKADFADRFAADTSTSMVWEFTGPLIDVGHDQQFKLTLPQIFFDTDTPTADGPAVVKTSYNFVSQFDGTNLPTILYKSADTTL